MNAVARIVGNGSMAVATGLRSMAEDPLTFAIQVARRFPAARGPFGFLSSVARGAEGSLLRTWIAGDLQATRIALDEMAARRNALGTISSEIAQAAGRPELVVDDRRTRPATRARAAWMLGDASLALSLLAEHHPGSRLHRALRAELALMTPGTRLRWARRAERTMGPRAGVLHLLTNSLPHTQSGYTVRSHAVLEAQQQVGLAPSAMTRLGYPVVVGQLTAAKVDSIDGISYHRALPTVLAPTPDGRLNQQADELMALAAQVRPAALQTTTHYPNALVVREVAAALEVPWAYEVRGMLEQTWVASLGSEDARERAMTSERFRLTREREAELAGIADAVFTLSESMRDDLAQRGVPRERIHLAPNAIDPELLERPRVDAADAREVLGLPRDGFWVGSTSSLVEYEGFDVLIEAVRLCRAEGLDIRMLLVGDGTARRALEQQAAASGIGEAAVLVGRVDRTRADAYRDALDAIVVPRLDLAVTRTVSPLKPVEAMASGRPLLVSALPPLLEAVGARIVGLGAAVRPGDARALADRIGAVARDPGLRRELAPLGRERAATRTWPAVGAMYRSTFAALGVQSSGMEG